jgi:hypothetical protein
MTGKSSSVLGASLGAWLDPALFDLVAKSSWDRISRPAATVFNQGWSGFGYRMRAAAEDANAYPRWFQDEPAASGEDRYQQERHAFGFFANACSASECLLYAVHGAALGFSNTPPSVKNLRRGRLEMIAAIEAVSALTALGSFLRAEFASAACTSMFETRDVFVHRGRSPRNHFAGGPHDGKITVARNPKSAPQDWENTLEISKDFLHPSSSWLVDFTAKSVDQLSRALT